MPKLSLQSLLNFEFCSNFIKHFDKLKIISNQIVLIVSSNKTYDFIENWWLDKIFIMANYIFNCSFLVSSVCQSMIIN